MKAPRILVVEDEFIVSMEIKERLGTMGYEVAGSAASGEQALEVASLHKPDLVLMDIRLRGDMDGIAAAEKIHNEFNIPVIFLTAYSEDETLNRAKLAEPFGYILKPFDDRELKSAIEIALYKHRTENEMRRMNRLYDVLSQVNQAVVRATEREELLPAVCRLIVERGAMDLAWIGCMDAQRSCMHSVACSGVHTEMVGEAKFFPDSSGEGQACPGRLIREGKPFICNECREECCPYSCGQDSRKEGFQSCASFPLWFQGEVFGALNVCMGEPGFFREKEIGLLQEVAFDVSFALDKIEGDARRKIAEKSLAESEERLRLFIEHAPVALAMFDREMRYLSVSRRWLSDYHLDERDLIGLSHYEVFPKIPERWRQFHRQALAGKVVRADEDSFTQAKGWVQWLRWEARPWRRANGEIGGIVIFSEDITERKTAEKLLRESEERYRLAMDATSDGLWDWDLAAGTVYFSPNYYRMLGFEPGELTATPEAWFDLIHPGDRERALGANEACIRNESQAFSVEFRMRARDGSWRWILGRGKAIGRDADGRALHMIGTHVDITGQKLRQKELEQLHRQNERILNAAGEGIVGLDVKGRITFVNPAALEILGYEQEKVTGAVLHELIHHHKTDGTPYPAKECPTCSTLIAGSPVRVRDEVLWRKDGTSFPSAFSAMPIVEEGKICGAVVTFRDITLRKRVMDALRESEAKYRNIFENAVEGIFQSSLEGRFISVNPAFARICGFSSPEEMMASITDIGTQLYVNPADRTAMLELVTTVGGANNAETLFRRADGRTLRVSVNVKAVRDKEGKLLCLEGTVEDITERKRHERERDLTVEFLRLMQEAGNKRDMIAASIAFFRDRLDCEAVGIRLNEGEDYPYFETSGYSPEFIRAESKLCTRREEGRPVLDCMCGDVISGRVDPSNPFFTRYGSFWTNNIAELQGCAIEQEYRRGRCVAEGYLSVALIPLYAGTERTGLLQLNDRRKERFTSGDIALCEQLAGYLAVALAKFDSEERLRDSEEHLKTMFEMASIGIVEGDPQSGLYTRVNQRMCEITGYSSTELVGMHRSQLTHPDDQERDREQFENLVGRKSKVYRLEKRYVRKDGGVIWVNVNGALIRDASGQPVRTVATIEDITERKKLEEEQAAVEAQLRQAQKLEALGTLAGGVAHDFNNILGIIMGYTELSKMETNEDSPLGKKLQNVLNASTRAKELVKQILAFSRRSEHRMFSLQFDLIVKEAMKMLRPSLPLTIEIKTEVVSKSVVFADPTQMHQVLMNLCTNAAHSMREKGGVLEVALRDRVLKEEDIRPSDGLQPGRFVELTVRDTGHGIDPGIIDLIFDPFFTTKELGEGTGLGLSVVHGIVKNHEGTIRVESTVGKGTTFRVLVPAREAGNEGKSEEVDGTLPRGKERVLVVDDEPLLADMVRMLLARLGYDAVARTSGADALETFRTQAEGRAFDLVITDMTMPHLTGKDLARELSTLGAEVPVILMTGFSEKMDAEKAKLSGMQGFLMKPVALKDLAKQVRRVLDGKG